MMTVIKDEMTATFFTVSSSPSRLLITFMAGEDSPARLDNGNPHQQLLMHETYQRLCFDDPLGITMAGCVALHKALVNVHSPHCSMR
jgi:hypothetical protein